MPLDPIEGEYKEPKLKLKDTTKDKTYKKVVCPSCSNEVSAQDINIGDKIAKCGSCNNIFSFQHEIESLIHAPKSNSKSKPRVGNQKDVDIYEYAGELSIGFRDINDWWAFIAMTIGTIFLFGTLIASKNSPVNPITLALGISSCLLYTSPSPRDRG